MTDEEKSLFDASLRRDDRVSPLVYADWLTERGRDREAAYWRQLVEFRTRYAAAPAEYRCSSFMYSCGEFLNGFRDLERSGCPQCRRWAWLNLAEESDRWRFGMKDKLDGRAML